MSITPELKRMLAGREAISEQDRVDAALARSPKKMEEVEAAMKMVDMAQPFIDEHATDPTQWKPSALLRIGYCLLSTGDNPRSALSFVIRRLEIARRRFRDGLDPNPFLPPDAQPTPVSDPISNKGER